MRWWGTRSIGFHVAEGGVLEVDRHERIALLHHLFSTHKYGLTVARLLEETGSDRATLYRDLADLQYRHRAPLAHDGKKPASTSM